MAATVEDAVAASPLTVAILADKAALVTSLAGVADGALAGSTLLNLGTGRPEEVAECCLAVERTGSVYLDGAVSGHPSDLGTPKSQVLVAGPERAWQRHRGDIELIAGRTRYLGPRLQAPSALDLAMVGCFQTVSLCAFLEAAVYYRPFVASHYRPFAADLAILSEEGARLLEKMRDQLDVLSGAVASGQFETDQATLGVYLAALDQVTASMGDAGRAARLTRAARKALAVAAADGQSEQGLAAQVPYL